MKRACRALACQKALWDWCASQLVHQPQLVLRWCCGKTYMLLHCTVVAMQHAAVVHRNVAAACRQLFMRLQQVADTSHYTADHNRYWCRSSQWMSRRSDKLNQQSSRFYSKSALNLHIMHALFPVELRSARLDVMAWVAFRHHFF